VGAHESGLIGEDPSGIPNNLLPYITQVAVGKLPELAVFGNDYPTPDGTGVRDYIHVVDLADGHLRALQAIQTRNGANVWNLGTGQGYSVLNMLSVFEAASGRKEPYRFSPRQLVDVASSYADVAKAATDLGWNVKRGLEDMMRDAWSWRQMKPNGYSEGFEVFNQQAYI
jgi:UDP-glucose 4-epimerase